MSKKLHAPHPGKVLKETLDGLKVTQYQIAKALGIPHSRMTAIIKGRQGVTVATALKLGKYLGTSPDYWLNIQRHYDKQLAEDELHDELEAIAPLAM